MLLFLRKKEYKPKKFILKMAIHNIMSINTIIVDFLSSLSDLIKRKCKVVYTLYFLTLLVRMYFSFLFKCYLHRDHKELLCWGRGGQDGHLRRLLQNSWVRFSVALRP